MIKIDGLVLRALEPKDAEALYQFKNDWEAVRQLGGFLYGLSRQNICDWIQAHRNCQDEVFWAISDGHACIGHVGLYKVDMRARSAEFGILIGNRSSWGKGVGTRVTATVLEWAFTQLNLHRVYLSVLATNTRAIALYERLGFVREGVLRQDQFRDGRYVDVVVMGILKDEFKQDTKPQ